MTGENGNYVTRAELQATVQPIQEDVAEIKTDVKSLLKYRAGKDAISHFFWKGLAIIATLSSGGMLGLFFH